MIFKSILVACSLMFVSSFSLASTLTLDELADRKPAEFEAAVQAVEPYLEESADGLLVLNVPEHVESQLDPEVFQALQSSLDVYNDVEQRGIPGAIISFVKKFWKPILEAAKKSAKWAWYKAPQCAYGAQNQLFKQYGGNLAYMTAHPSEALAAAIYGCIRAL